MKTGQRARFSGHLLLVIAEFLVPVGFFHASAHTAFHTMEELSPNSRENPLPHGFNISSAENATVIQHLPAALRTEFIPFFSTPHK
jgi:hypothetical protein